MTLVIVTSAVSRKAYAVSVSDINGCGKRRAFFADDQFDGIRQTLSRCCSSFDGARRCEQRAHLRDPASGWFMRSEEEHERFLQLKSGVRLNVSPAAEHLGQNATDAKTFTKYS